MPSISKYPNQEDKALMAKKVSVLIIISILFVALLNLTGCVPSSSNEDTSSESSSSESSDDDSSDESKIEKYTDKEVGFTVSLPSYWIERDPEEVTDESYLHMVFTYYDGKDGASIYCNAYSGYEGVSFSDYTKEVVAEIYSVSVDDVSKKKLSSGSYYLVKQSDQDSDNNGHSISYETLKNDYLIHFMYVSPNENDPHLSDFEDMVDSVKYD